MPRNGNGVYTLPSNSWNPAVTGTTIESSANNATMNDLASAMTQSVSKDGQTTMTGDLPMGNNKITGLANGTATTDAMTYGQGAKLSGGNTFTGDQTINGAVSLSGSLTVTGPVIFSSGTITVDNLTVSSVASIASLNVTGNTVLNTLTVASAAVIAVLSVGSSLVVGAASGGSKGAGTINAASTIYINGDAVASPYITGTFTPGMTFGGSAAGITYSTQTGRYTKIGNIVIVQIRIVLTNNGSGSGAAVLTGLPFTAIGSATPATLTPFSGFASMTGAPAGNVVASTTTAALLQTTATATTALTETNVTDSASFAVQIVYEAA